MGKKSSKETLADETDQLVNSILDGALEGGGVSLAGSLAKISAPQTIEPPDLPENAQDSSGRWLKPFAWLAQSQNESQQFCWRTWQRSFDQKGNLTWALYSEPWPPAGVIQNGIAWEREPLAHPNIAPEHTFLPAILANEYKGACRGRFRGSQSLISMRVSE